MASSAEKERERPAQIEAGWIPPDPIVPPVRIAIDDERIPSPVRRALAELERSQWAIACVYSEPYGFPSWRTVHEDDANLSYVARPTVLMEVEAIRDRQLWELISGHLGGIHVVYLEGKPIKCHVGLIGEPEYREVPTVSLAKFV